ncbi:MAG: two-component sensor histidine kinase [Proteobacteria bacterium]|nr:two-component sensor histidine kinase [Pseudomonadota bacterium]
MTSIRRALLVPLALGLLLAIAGAAVLTYLAARDEATALLDVQLQQMAASVTGMPIQAPSTALGSDAANPLVVQVWNRDGVQVYRSDPGRDAPRVADTRNAQPGFATIPGRDGLWRVFSVAGNGQIVQVGQPLRVRNELAAAMAWRTTLPLIIIAPILGLFVWLAIERALRPLSRLAGAVRIRTADDLAPLPAGGWPLEIEPLVAALNALLARLQETLALQRTFVADAAHELRTPLAALHLQAQLAARARDDGERGEALAAMKGGIDRATRLASQLLTLAREEHADARDALDDVDLTALARDVVRDLAPLAAQRDIDLGVSGTVPAVVRGDAAALTTLLTNLVDNALRYVPAGGRIDVSTERNGAGDAVLAVRDDGPGIPAGERETIFQRFTRGSNASAPGSGLGLAIVKRIADRHGATLALGDGLDGRGLGVTVTLGSDPIFRGPPGGKIGSDPI